MKKDLTKGQQQGVLEGQCPDCLHYQLETIKETSFFADYRCTKCFHTFHANRSALTNTWTVRRVNH